MFLLFFVFQFASFNTKVFAANFDPIFSSLLYIYKDSPDVKDQNFYINNQFINLDNERIEEEKIFFEKRDLNKICQFPARYFYLRKKLNIDEDLLSQCQDLIEFKNKVPADEVSIVFASENISLPTSMMGHIFLKLSGKNYKNDLVEHAVSFFTDVDNISFLKVIYGSLIFGLDGIYALNPYQEVKTNYLYNEQRNLYEYTLKLNQFERELLLLHLYELKNIKFKYLFHAFNCATVMSNVLSINLPEIKNERNWWMTPLDVVRALEKYQYIESTKVILSSEWKIKSLQDSYSFPPQIIDEIKEKKFENLIDKNRSRELQFLDLELAKSYNDYLLENKTIEIGEWNKNDDYLKNKKEEVLPHGTLDLSTYKSPAKTIQDSQIYLGQSSKNQTSLGLLFASHYLTDDTSNYSNESELKLGDIRIAFDHKEKQFIFKHINIYSAEILRPHDPILGGLSFKFDLSFLNENLDLNSWSTYFGVGKTLKLHNDFTIYGMGLSEAKTNSNHGLYLGPEIGFVFKQIFNIKMTASYKYQLNLFHPTVKKVEWNVIEQINLNSYAFGLKYLNQRESKQKYNNLELFYKFFF